MTREADRRADPVRIGSKDDRPVVGRAGELELLNGSWTIARGGTPQVVLVDGAAGVGKTTLVRTFLASVPDVPVLWASCDELEQELAFGVAGQMLGTSPADLLATGDAMAVGARMLQALGDRDQDGPVIVVVDDIGWADLPSMQAIAFAIRRLHSDPVLVLLTVRSEVRGRVPNSILQSVESRGVHVHLEGLSGDDLAELVAVLGLPPLPSRTLSRLAEHTGGSPLHALALLDELDELDALAAGDLAPLAAPRSFAELVELQLRSLSNETQQLITAAAVVGMHAPVPRVADLAEIADPTLALDEAVLAGLVTVAPRALYLELRFLHPLTRAAIYHGMALTRRAGLHRRAAELAGRAGDRPTSLRHRSAAVTGFDGPLAAELAAFAEAELRRPAGAASAAGWYQLAARLAPNRAIREDFVLRAIESLVLAGDAAGAMELAVVLDSFRDSPRKGYLVGALLLAQGQLGPAVQMLQEAWDTVDAGAEPDLAGAIAGTLAVVMVNTAELDDAVAWAQRAVDLSSAGNLLGSSPISVQPVALAASGRYAEAFAATEPIPTDDRDVDPDALQRLTGRGTARLWADDLRGSIDDLERAVRIGREAGIFLPYAVALCYLAEAEYRLGRWDDALLHAELIASLAADLDQVWFVALPHGTAALAPANRGDWATAEAHVALALAAAARQGDAASEMWSRTAEATLAAARGDHGAALAAATACLAHPGIGRVHEPGVKPWRILGAEACAATGELELADQFLSGVDRGFATPSLAVARARGLVAAARGDHDEAGHWFDAAATFLSRCDDPFERAQLHLANGAHLRRRGQRRRAAEELGRAREVFVGLQAAPWIERVDGELAVSGLSPAARDERHHVELTPQEQAIVRLVVQGRRNREIATDLFISVKTVEYHLGNAFRKLGVSSRTQLIAAVGGSQVA